MVRNDFPLHASPSFRWLAGGLVLAGVLGCLSLKLGSGLLTILALLAVSGKLRSMMQRRQMPEGLITFVCVAISIILLCSAVGLGSVVIKFVAKHGQAMLPEFFEQLRSAAKKSSLESLRSLGDIGDAQYFAYLKAWATGQFSLLMSMTGSSLRFLAQLFFAGLIVVSALTLQPSKSGTPGGLINGLKHEGSHFLNCFSHLLTAQLYVSLWNTFCTIVYVMFILPLFDISLPLREGLIIATFFLSFVPALGNILANTTMVVLCLQFPPWVLFLSASYLIGIHKMEYLINAKILSSAYRASVAELLIGIVVGETLFGLPGLITFPVIYLYVKDFLNRQAVL